MYQRIKVLGVTGFNIKENILYIFYSISVIYSQLYRLSAERIKSDIFIGNTSYNY